jgi:hypothetical protein
VRISIPGRVIVFDGATGHHFTGVDGLRAFLTGLAG